MKLIKRLEYIASEILTALCCTLLRSLKNGRSLAMEREELRAVRLSFSQFGEDLVVADLARMLDVGDKTYVDVGAFDPLEASNTLLLYKQGWHGVNVDLDFGKIEKFNKSRPQDHNVCACVADRPSLVMVARYGRTMTNRVVSHSSENSLCNEGPLSLEKDVQATTLTSILDKSPLANHSIGFLNVDCEGNDLQVLLGLDFDRYRPNIIAVEAHTKDEEAQITAFLEAKGYALQGKVCITLIFSVSTPTVADRL